MQPLLGRMITRADGKTGAAPVFAMSHRLWKKQFNSDPSLVGKTLVLNGEPRTLVAVMPPRFLLGNVDIWVPNNMNRSDPANRTARVLDAGAPEARRHDAAGSLRFRGHRAATGQDVSRRFPQEVHGAVEDAHRRRGRAVQEDAVHAAGGGQHAAADRVQQRRQPAAGAGHGARTRDRHPRVDGRQPRTHRPPIAGGEPDARPRRLPAGLPVRLLRTEGRYRRDARPDHSGGSGAAAELARPAVCRRRDRTHHVVMRTRSRAARRARRPAHSAERYRQGRQRRISVTASFAPGW